MTYRLTLLANRYIFNYDYSMQGQVFKIHSDFYYVKDSNKILTCKLKETLKKQKTEVAVGDYVELSSDCKFITKITERKNYLLRPKVANIDCCIIVSALKQPELNYTQLDRYLTLLNYFNIPIVLCFNKEDLENNLNKVQDEITDIYSSLCKKIFFISAKEKTGIDELIKYLKGKTVALCGQSGVGKSSLLNAINPKLEIKTSEISSKTLRGTHTTRHVEIIDFEDFRIVDTPGFSNLKFNFILPAELINFFPDIIKFKGGCKFSDCTHDTKEKNICSIVDNLDKIKQSRYLSYLTFLEECKSYKSEISKKSIKNEGYKKTTGSKTLTKISKEKRAVSRNTDKQRMKNYDNP